MKFRNTTAALMVQWIGYTTLNSSKETKPGASQTSGISLTFNQNEFRLYGDKYST